MSEIWRPVSVPYAYEVSDHGRVRRSGAEHVLKGTPGNHGYPCVRLSRKSQVREHLIHRLVFEAFVGPIPEKMTINHIDGIKTNNRVENLELATKAANNAHALRLGLNAPPPSRRGADNPRALLTDEQVAAIRDAFRQNPGYGAGRRLARQYGVSEGVVSLIKKQKTYKVVCNG